MFIKGCIPWNKGEHPLYLQGKNHPNWKNKIKKTCPICKRIFLVKPSLDRVTYCSKKCSFKAREGSIPWNKDLKTGIVPKTAFKKGMKSLHPYPKGHIPWNKGVIFEAIRDSNHWNWKGGKPKIARKQELLSYGDYRKYKDWQHSVFKRDKWTCQTCGKVGGELHADHLKPWALYPKLRYVILNGRTLCPPCHRKTETYGRKVHKYLPRRHCSAF